MSTATVTTPDIIELALEEDIGPGDRCDDARRRDGSNARILIIAYVHHIIRPEGKARLVLEARVQAEPVNKTTRAVCDL